MDEEELVIGGCLSQSLGALVESYFIVKYVPFGYSKRMEHYKLIDPFCMFYIELVLSKKLSTKVITHNMLITTYRLKYNEYSNVFDNVITLDDLFDK